MPYTDPLKIRLVNGLFGDPAFTADTDQNLRLYTASPIEAGTGGTAVTGYTDIALDEAADMAAASGAGIVEKSNGVLFDFGAKASGGSQTIVAAGIVSTANGLLYYGALTASQTVDNGQIFQIAIGDLDVRLD